MPILVSCPNPECRQQCVVPDEYAGRLVRCPKCPALIEAPFQPAGAPAIPSDDFNLDLGEFRFNDGPPPDMPPPPPVAATGQEGDAIAVLRAFLLSTGVDKSRGIVLICALGCCLLLMLFVMLPWRSVWHPEEIERAMRIGLVTVSGALTLVFTLALTGSLLAAVFLRNRVLFPIALWSLAGWGALSALWRVIEIVTAHGRVGLYRWSASFGLYFALLASLGLAGTAGYVALARLFAKRGR